MPVLKEHSIRFFLHLFVRQLGTFGQGKAIPNNGSFRLELITCAGQRGHKRHPSGGRSCALDSGNSATNMAPYKPSIPGSSAAGGGVPNELDTLEMPGRRKVIGL
jgi:hypothetical protein